ncbi:FCD domain-containing protein [Actinosynnema sp. NPDC047251]|uniref:Transcriptional regulator, GntR family n=1 Tax=Saccharothrix espanaensis (strain ATCC 51144 / DSM 44229 / JCM 9112 / NBRC 15066 / NRRL 15764) TaxID=1179773 RepID=K0K148_SACES|nr:FCD domain-containing protein [Saccharothrix espanaensis]CCH31282.1 Transcriptional regulator, GntR family [Saccharothrix espanaensis DSM 44229]
MNGYAAVLRHVEDQLAAGRLTVGGQLPAERRLAEQLGVSRPTVREAIRVLQALGVVRSGVGSGPDAGTTVIADPAGGLGTALRLHLATRRLPLADLVGTRVMIEGHSARAAAGVRDCAELDRAADLLDRMDDPELDADAFHQLDADFHVALTAAAGNAVNTAVMAALRDAIHTTVLDAVATLPDWNRTAVRLRREHRGVLRAIRAGDGDTAAQRVTRHVEGFYREWARHADPA